MIYWFWPAIQSILAQRTVLKVIKIALLYKQGSNLVTSGNRNSGTYHQSNSWKLHHIIESRLLSELKGTLMERGTEFASFVWPQRCNK